jgi:hypothetical protein
MKVACEPVGLRRWDAEHDPRNGALTTGGTYAAEAFGETFSSTSKVQNEDGEHAQVDS